MERSQDTIIGPPRYTLDEPSSEKGAYEWPAQKAEDPDVDPSRPLVKEEHVMNDTETDDLGSSVEPALECAEGSEAAVARGEGCS